jgi:hypothetical protein
MSLKFQIGEFRWYQIIYLSVYFIVWSQCFSLLHQTTPHCLVNILDCYFSATVMYIIDFLLLCCNATTASCYYYNIIDNPLWFVAIVTHPLFVVATLANPFSCPARSMTDGALCFRVVRACLRVWVRACTRPLPFEAFHFVNIVSHWKALRLKYTFSQGRKILRFLQYF